MMDAGGCHSASPSSQPPGRATGPSYIASLRKKKKSFAERCMEPSSFQYHVSKRNHIGCTARATSSTPWTRCTRFAADMVTIIYEQPIAFWAFRTS